MCALRLLSARRPRILKSLQPKLDEVSELEARCKQGALEVDLAEGLVEVEKDSLAAAQAAGEREAEADKAKLVELLNERAKVTEALENVLVELSTDPEMRSIQEEHEAEKLQVTKRSMGLQEELQSSELRERHERATVDAHLEGVMHTARNLGQIAAYFLQTGAAAEAAEFYSQAKAIFDEMLGPEHPQTLAWQQDLFFLINAPVIQSMVKKAATTMGSTDAVARHEDAPTGSDGSAQQWWMKVPTAGTLTSALGEVH